MLLFFAPHQEEASKESSAEDEMVSQLTLGTYSSPFTVPEHQEKLSEENGETETEPAEKAVWETYQSALQCVQVVSDLSDQQP